MKDALEAERPLRRVEFSDDERRQLRSYGFLSEKPVLLVANLGEDQVGEAAAVARESSGLTACAASRASRAVPVVGPHRGRRWPQLSAEDARAFREDLGLTGAGPRPRGPAPPTTLPGAHLVPDRAGRTSAAPGPSAQGTKARPGGGRHPPDIERGFIRAEVVAYADLMAAGSRRRSPRARDAAPGEGKDYVVQDGDVINFRFNV